MRFYLDTSVIISTLINDAHSNRAEAWLAGQSSAALVVSHWTAPEISSALAIRLRRNVLNLDAYRRALAGWQQLYRESFQVVLVEPPNFTRAAALIDRHALGLRAPDALHLAIAEAVGATMATFDERLADACNAIGVRLAMI